MSVTSAAAAEHAAPNLIRPLSVTAGAGTWQTRQAAPNLMRPLSVTAGTGRGRSAGGSLVGSSLERCHRSLLFVINNL